MKTAAILLAVLLGIGAAAPCYCQPPESRQRVVKTIDAQIYDMDWVGSKILLRWLDTYDNSYHELTVTVPEGAVIKKGADIIGFSQLEIDDAVTVRYYEDSDGNAVLIELQDTAP